MGGDSGVKTVAKTTPTLPNTVKRQRNPRKLIEFSPVISALSDDNKTIVFDDNYDMVSRTPQIKAKISFDNKITKNSIEFLLDSGASFSCISQSLFDKLRNQIDIPVLSRKRPSPMSASSNILQPIAETEFDLLFTNENINLKIKKVRFSVFQRLNFSGIIGYEVLRKLDMRINPKGSAVSLHSQWFELTGETIDPNVVNFYSLNFSGDLSYDIYQVGILNLKTAEPHQEASSKTLEFLTTFDSGNPVTGDIDIFLTFCTVV